MTTSMPQAASAHSTAGQGTIACSPIPATTPCMVEKVQIPWLRTAAAARWKAELATTFSSPTTATTPCWAATARIRWWATVVATPCKAGRATTPSSPLMAATRWTAAMGATLMCLKRASAPTVSPIPASAEILCNSTSLLPDRVSCSAWVLSN